MMIQNMITDEKQTVKVGDYVSFKYDREDCGKIVEIRGGYLDIEYINDEEEEHTVTVHKSDCWLEE